MAIRSVKNFLRILAVSSLITATATFLGNGTAQVARASTDDGSLLPANSAQNPFPYAIPSYCSVKTTVIQGYNVKDGSLGEKITANVASCRGLAGTSLPSGAFASLKEHCTSQMAGMAAHMTEMRPESSCVATREGVRPRTPIAPYRDGRPLSCSPNQTTSGRAREYDYNHTSSGSWVVQWEEPSGALQQGEIDTICPSRPNGFQYCDVPYNFPKSTIRAYYHISFYWSSPGTIQSAGCYS